MSLFKTYRLNCTITDDPVVTEAVADGKEIPGLPGWVVQVPVAKIYGNGDADVEMW